MFRVFLKSAAMLAAATFVFSPFISPAKAVEVYLFKGAGDFSFINSNMHFSRGLEKIAKQMNAEGIHAEVRRFGAVDEALKTIRRRKPKSVAFIGHSMGALASMALARSMRSEGIRVAYVGLIDIPGPVGVAGENVDWAENYFSINPVYGKLTNTRSHPKAKNIHVGGYIHNRMDDAPKVQKGLLAAVRAVHAAEQRQLEPSVPQYQAPAQPAFDPWAGQRVATIQTRQKPSNSFQYTPDVQTFAAPSSIVRQGAIQPAPFDSVTTSSTFSRPKVAIGAAN